MKYKKVPQELISNWFIDKMQFSLNKEQLNNLCSQIDNHVKINYTRCCMGEAEQLVAYTNWLQDNYDFEYSSEVLAKEYVESS